MRWHWRPDTLFARLLLMQLSTVLAVMLVLGLLFYLERNLAISRLVAQRWAPVLAEALRAPERVPLGSERPEGAGPWRRDSLPPLAVSASTWVPRLKALQQALQALGVPVLRLAVSRAAGHPIIWIQVRLTDGRVQWLGFSDEVLEPLFPARLGLALLLAMALVLGVSAWMARRLSAPLGRLRERMAGHVPGTAAAGAAALDAGQPAGPAPTVELAQIEQAWQQLADRLAAHETERQLLLAGVSHDLRSPLARVRMAAELLPEAPGVAERRAAIVRNVEVADRLLQSFLDLVRAGSVPLDETVDLAALARQVLALRGESGLSLQAPVSLPLAGTQALALERAMNNLLDNAQHHGAPPVVLRVGSGPDGAWIEVQDAGPGIPEAERDAVLRAFARGDRSRGRPGTGLGLAVVVALARRMGGTVRIDGGPGDLRVRMGPLRPPGSARAAQAPQAGQAQTQQPQR